MTTVNNKVVSAEDIIKRLDLTPHPEGGFYRETYRAAKRSSDGMAQSTAAYYLMVKDRGLAWHSVGSDEFWHFYAGDPVEAAFALPDGTFHEKKVFGPDVLRGQEPQVLIPANWWQSAKCVGEWTLFGCTVSPGFEFEDYKLAPAGWKPTGM